MLELYPNPKPYTDDAAHAARDDRRVAADPVDAQPHRRSGPVADEHRAVHQQGHGADSLELLRSEQGVERVRSSRRHAHLRDSRTRRRRASRSRTPPECVAHGYDWPAGVPCRSAGTTAFAVADADGNVVSTTQTLGTWGGNFYVTPGLGFLYNDKLSSFGGDPTAYGARLPFSRGGSTITPDDRVRGIGQVAARGDGVRRCRQRVDHVGGVPGVRRHDRPAPRPAGRARAAAVQRWRVRRWRWTRWRVAREQRRRRAR